MAGGGIAPMRSYEDLMREVESKEGHLIRKVLIYISPLTKDLEYRVAYFTSAAEACIWEGEMMKRYQELGTIHECYTEYMNIVRLMED